MPAMAEAYMVWMLAMKEEGFGGQFRTPPIEIQGQVNIEEVSLFCTLF